MVCTCYAEIVENVVKKVLGMGFVGYKRNGRPKKSWIESVKEDMTRLGINSKMTLRCTIKLG